MTATASSSGRSQTWNLIWNLCLPPKLQLFLWKVCNRALPTLSNLRSRGIRLDEGCSFRGLEEEDAMHILLRCPFARLVWAVSGVYNRNLKVFEGAEMSALEVVALAHRQLESYDSRLLDNPD
ncbi:UNVERIFIED_CONTAM: hypothetical protein Slati_2173400 [Sesamum latifolium]|uniref:Reverse transcriptase zinc-binding domain-containing protein n=1 Tax=Sesamum latifolium TaxID=2727402 RepID=A0AAW2WRM3_9LAMI